MRAQPSSDAYKAACGIKITTTRINKGCPGLKNHLFELLGFLATAVMALALAFDHLHVKGAVMVRAADVIYWPLAGAVAVAVARAKESQHCPSGIGIRRRFNVLDYSWMLNS
jgi:hypothetical protein